MIKVAKCFTRIGSRRVTRRSLNSLGRSVSQLIRLDWHKSLLMLHGVLHYCDHSQKSRAGLDLRPLTFIRESGLAQRCDVDVAFVKFSCDKCCPSLRPVYSSDTHERSSIPCASSDRCFHFDYTGETGYSWGTLCSPYFRPWRWAERFLRLLRLPGGYRTPLLLRPRREQQHGLSRLCASMWLQLPVYPHVLDWGGVEDDGESCDVLTRAWIGLKWAGLSCVFSSASLSRPHWDIWTSSRTWLRR